VPKNIDSDKFLFVSQIKAATSVYDGCNSLVQVVILRDKLLYKKL